METLNINVTCKGDLQRFKWSAEDNVIDNMVVDDPEELRGRWINAETMFKQLQTELENTDPTETFQKEALITAFMQMVEDFSKPQEILESILEEEDYIHIFFLDNEHTREIVNEEVTTTMPERVFEGEYKQLPARFPYDHNKSFSENIEEVMDKMTNTTYNPMTIKRRKKWVRQNLEHERYKIRSGDVILIRGEMYIVSGDMELEPLALT